MRARADAIARMDAWWSVFASRAEAIERHLRGGGGLDLPAFMGEHLGAVDRRLMWEFGPAVHGAGHRLVITAEGEHALRPIVEALLARAPRLPGWELYPYRIPDPLEVAEAMVADRLDRSVEGWRVSVLANEGGGVDLTFWSRRRAGLLDLAPWRGRARREEDERERGVALLAAERLLGEEVLHRWVDAVELARAPVRGATDLGLGELRASAEAIVARHRSALPDRPLAQLATAPAEATAGRRLLGYCLELKPGEAPDYARRDDLAVATTTLLPVWKRAHSGRPFSSARFSRCGETFCYLKLDGSEGLDPAGSFQDRADVQDALDEGLLREQLGCVFGGGTGLRYSYVDLALVDVERAIPVLRHVLQAGRIRRRTWLQFLDAELAWEWVGIWPDAPRPPGFD